MARNNSMNERASKLQMIRDQMEAKRSGPMRDIYQLADHAATILKPKTNYIEASDGVKLAYRVYYSKETPKAFFGLSVSCEKIPDD